MDTGTKDTPIVFDPENDLRNQQKEQAAALINPNMRTFYTTYVSVAKQITEYYCGPASAYMVIKAWDGNVPSTTRSLAFFQGCPGNCPYPNVPHTCYQSYTSPQITLVDEMNMGYGGADFIMLKSALNNHIGTNYYSYKSIPGTTAGLNTLKSYIASTLSGDYPLIAWVKANQLDRYSDTTFQGHYVCVYSYDSSTGLVGIADPHYMSNYGGKYTEDVSTLHSAMYKSDGSANLLW